MQQFNFELRTFTLRLTTIDTVLTGSTPVEELRDLEASHSKATCKMLIDGPREWAESVIPTGSKLDLLTHAYNAKIGVGAFSKHDTVALVRYQSSTNGAASLPADEVVEIATEEVSLHQSDAENSPRTDTFRFVCWSSSTPRHLLAIATTERVEIWRVHSSESLRATLLGALSRNRIRCISWNPARDTLCVLTDSEFFMVDVTSDDNIVVADTHVKAVRGNGFGWKQCVWSPCGLTLARSNERQVQFLSWPSVSLITVAAPSLASHSMDTTPKDTLEVTPPIGSVTAVALLSASVCIVVTDVPLVLDQVKPPSPEPPQVSIANVPLTMPPTSNVIDLTSLRITAATSSSILRILDPPKAASNDAPAKVHASQLAILTKSTEHEWRQLVRIPLPHLSIPDVIETEAMRVVIGSTISNRIIALHLDHIPKSGWVASVSGELELPEGTVCRGLRLAKTSPFVQVASTAKTKRFFFSTTSGPQRIQLSKFKLPRRQRVTAIAVPDPAPVDVAAAVELPATEASASTTLEVILSRMDSLQAAMNARFDRLEDRVNSVATRLEQLEVQRLSL